MVAVGLARESSEAAEKQLAYDFQVERLTEYGCRWIYGDRVSGTKDNRKGLEQALEKIKSGEADELVVTHFTRLARSVVTAHRVIQTLKKHNARLTVLDSPVDTSTPEGRFAFQLRAGLAELEADLGAERQKIGWQNSRAKARPRAPVFGYLIQDGRYVPDEENWEIAKAVVEKFLELHSLSATVVWLVREHGELRENPRQRRPPYTARGLRQWMLNQTLIGSVVFSDAIHLSQHPALITREQQDEIRQIIASRILGVVRTQERRYAYTGLVFCGVCGARAAKLTTPKDDGSGNYVYYRCCKVRTGECDNRPRIRLELVEEATLAAVAEHAEVIRDWLARPITSLDGQEQQDPKVLELRAKADHLIRAPYQDEWTQSRIADLEREINNLVQTPIKKPLFTREEQLEILEGLHISDLWDRYNPKEKFDRLRMAIKQIFVQDGQVVQVEFQPWLSPSDREQN